MTAVLLNIVVLVTLFSFVNMVSCDSFSWGEWTTYKGCQQIPIGIFSGWRIDMRPCNRLDDSGVRYEERNSGKCSLITDKFRVVNCYHGNKYYLKEEHLFTQRFQYPTKMIGSNKGTPFKFTVPVDGCYKISASGASGFFGPHVPSGATASGVFRLKKGLELTIVIGKYSRDLGAGGGTFVFTVTKDNQRGDLFVVAGGAGYHKCDKVDIDCEFNGQDSEEGVSIFSGSVGYGGTCRSHRPHCSWTGAGWLSSGCGDDDCDLNGKSFEDGFVGAADGGGFGGAGSQGGGGYTGGGNDSTGGGSFVNSKAKQSNKHKNYPSSNRKHGTASVELVEDNQC